MLLPSRNLPRAVYWMAGATLVNRIGAMVFPFLVLYFHRGLELNLETATALVGLWGLGSLLAGPLGGWAADRFDCLRLLAFSLAGAGTLMVSFPLWTNPLMLALVTFTLALTADLSRPASLTALARLAGEEHRRDAFALNYLAINLGMSIGPTMAGYLAEINYHWLFWIDGGTSLLAAALLYFSGLRCAPEPDPATLPDWKLGAPAFRMLAFLVLAFCAFMGFFAAIPVYATSQLGVGEHDCGLIWLFNTVLIVFSSIALTRWTQGTDMRKLLALSISFIGSAYVALYFLPNLPGVVLATLLLTIGEMLMFPNVNGYLSAVVEPHKIGRAMGCNAICVSLAISIVSPLSGYFFTHLGAPALWEFMMAISVVAALGFSTLPSPPA